MVFLDSLNFLAISRFQSTVAAVDSAKAGFGIKIDRMLVSSGAQVMCSACAALASVWPVPRKPLEACP